MEKPLTVRKQQEMITPWHGFISHCHKNLKKFADVFSLTSEETCMESVWYEYAKARDHLENQAIDGILTHIFEKRGRKARDLTILTQDKRK
jgi:hypothetical protein